VNVDVNEVSKTFYQHIFSKKGYKAVDNISFTLERGELLSVLGHNGVIYLFNHNNFKGRKNNPDAPDYWLL